MQNVKLKDWLLFAAFIVIAPFLLGFVFSSFVALFKLGWNVW